MPARDLGRGGSGPAVSVASKCITIGGKRICREDDNAKNKDADDEDPARSAPRRTAIAPKTAAFRRSRPSERHDVA
jgi:hypothetical protein